MALNVHKGHFFTPASNNTLVTVTGTGFLPEALVIWGNNEAATGFSSGLNSSIGFAVGSGIYNNSSIAAIGLDGNNGAVPFNNRFSQTYSYFSIVAVGNLASRAYMTRFNNDGFNMFFPNSTVANAYVHYLAIGGTDLTNVKLGTFGTSTSTGNVAYTGVGFKPDCLIFLGQSNFPAEQNAHVMIGMATSATQRGVNWHGTNLDGVPTYYSGQLQTPSGVLFAGNAFSGVTTYQADIVSLDNDGFTLNWTTSASGSVIQYLALKGGKYYVGKDTQKTSTGTKANTGPGFLPSGLLFTSATATPKSTIDITKGNLTLGGTDGVTQGNTWIGSADNVSITDEDRYNDITNVLTMNSVSSTQSAKAALNSLDTNGFTLNWTQADTTAREFLFLAMGSSGALFLNNPAVNVVTYPSAVKASTHRITGTTTSSSIAALKTPLKSLAASVTSSTLLSSIKRIGNVFINLSVNTSNISIQNRISYHIPFTQDSSIVSLNDIYHRIAASTSTSIATTVQRFYLQSVSISVPTTHTIQKYIVFARNVSVATQVSELKKILLNLSLITISNNTFLVNTTKKIISWSNSQSISNIKTIFLSKNINQTSTISPIKKIFTSKSINQTHTLNLLKVFKTRILVSFASSVSQIQPAIKLIGVLVTTTITSNKYVKLTLRETVSNSINFSKKCKKIVLITIGQNITIPRFIKKNILQIQNILIDVFFTYHFPVSVLQGVSVVSLNTVKLNLVTEIVGIADPILSLMTNINILIPNPQDHVISQFIYSTIVVNQDSLISPIKSIFQIPIAFSVDNITNLFPRHFIEIFLQQEISIAIPTFTQNLFTTSVTILKMFGFTYDPNKHKIRSRSRARINTVDKDVG